MSFPIHGNRLKYNQVEENPSCDMEVISSGYVHLYLFSNHLFTSNNGVPQDHGARLVKAFGTTGKIEIQDDHEGTKHLPYDHCAHTLFFMNMENYQKCQNMTILERLNFLAEDCIDLEKNQKHFVSGVREARSNVEKHAMYAEMERENKRMGLELKRMRSELTRSNELLDEIEEITKKRRTSKSSSSEATGAKSSSSEATGAKADAQAPGVVLISKCTRLDNGILTHHQSDAPSVLLFSDECDIPDWVPRDQKGWNAYAIFGEDDPHRYPDTPHPYCEATMNERLACISELVNQGKARFFPVAGKMTVDNIVGNTLSDCYEECCL